MYVGVEDSSERSETVAHHGSALPIHVPLFVISSYYPRLNTNRFSLFSLKMPPFLPRVGVPAEGELGG